MPDMKRGDDAADHAPKLPEPKKGVEAGGALSEKQDAPNYNVRVDGGRAEPVETINSANDK